jgi:hypothetical protein
MNVPFYEAPEPAEFEALESPKNEGARSFGPGRTGKAGKIAYRHHRLPLPSGREPSFPLCFAGERTGRAYLQIVESRRDGDQVRQQVIATLGRFDELQASGQLERLLRSGARCSAASSR